MSKTYIFKKTDFDYVNKKAKVVIVGITPGNNQLESSRYGMDKREIKRVNAFAGNMRKNLVDMLDHAGVNSLLKIDSCSHLWDEDCFDLVEMTSLLKEATFELKKDGREEMFKDTTQIIKHSELNKLFNEGFVADCANYSQAKLFVACGPGVQTILEELRDRSIITAPIIAVPHPSGANSGRIATFLNKREPNTQDTSYKWAKQQGIEAKQVVSKISATNE